MRQQAAMRVLGLYYLVFGVWPFVHRRSFTAIAGPKPDVFQLESTGATFAAAGAALLAGSRRRPVSHAARVLAAAAAVGAVAVEWRHRRDIRWVYAGDALVQLTLAGAAVVGQDEGSP